MNRMIITLIALSGICSISNAQYFGGGGIKKVGGSAVDLTVSNLTATGTVILPSPLYFGDIYTGNLTATNSLTLGSTTITNWSDIQSAPPTLQSVLNTGKTATNANVVIGSTNETLGKVAIVGEAGAYTNKPMLYMERTTSGTGNFISCTITGRVAGGIGLNGQLISSGNNSGTNYLTVMSWDATNKVFVVTETAQ
jgi:hypothetical protein